jgi:hypothetical protein
VKTGVQHGSLEVERGGRRRGVLVEPPGRRRHDLPQDGRMAEPEFCRLAKQQAALLQGTRRGHTLEQDRPARPTAVPLTHAHTQCDRWLPRFGNLGPAKLNFFLFLFLVHVWKKSVVVFFDS